MITRCRSSQWAGLFMRFILYIYFKSAGSRQLTDSQMHCVALSFADVFLPVLVKLNANMVSTSEKTGIRIIAYCQMPSAS